MGHNYEHGAAPTGVTLRSGMFLQELRSLRRNNMTADQIAVVTPYRRQVQRIKTLLTAKGYGSVQVRTPPLDINLAR